MLSEINTVLDNQVNQYDEGNKRKAIACIEKHDSITYFFISDKPGGYR